MGTVPGRKRHTQLADSHRLLDNTSISLLLALLVPLLVPTGLIAVAAAVVWVTAAHRTLERLREAHADHWRISGRPWLSGFGPPPERSGLLRSAPDQPWPSFAWTARFCWRALAQPLTGDDELDRLHRRASVLLRVTAVAAIPLLAVAVGFLGLVLTTLA